MPLYMDVHEKVDGLTAEAVAEAHRKDLETQHKHGVNYLNYWFNEEEGKVFCLFEAPSAEAGDKVHGRLTDSLPTRSSRSRRERRDIDRYIWERWHGPEARCDRGY